MDWDGSTEPVPELRIIQLDITGSTNADARKLAAEADFGPLWIIADQQTAGRGRHGRNWVSPKGNFYGSFLFPTEKPTAQRSLYSFVIALGIYDALKAVCADGGFELKWPNDVLLDGAKISGMLLESGSQHHQPWVIAGIGINLISFPDDTPYPAACLAEHSETPVEPHKMLEALSEKINHWKTVFDGKGFGPIRTAWLERAANVPGPVTVRLPDETFEGEARDLELNGALQVRLANGTIRQVHAGDVFPG